MRLAQAVSQLQRERPACPEAFTLPKHCPLPCAPRYGMSLTCPSYQRRLLRNICPLGENARLSLKRDSYADFSLCANAPCLLGSDPIVSWLSRPFLTIHWLSSPLLRQRAFHPPLKRQGLSSPFSVTLRDVLQTTIDKLHILSISYDTWGNYYLQFYQRSS